MAVTPASIGKAQCKVYILPNSPFAGIPRQEFGYFFTQDNLPNMTLSGNRGIVALPSPVNGFRLAENVNNYDNYLVDTGGEKLEDAIADTGGNGVINVDSAAKTKAALAQARSNSSQTQKDFFTWQTIEPFIKNNGKYDPVYFKDMLKKSGSSAKWTYNLKPKPDGAQSELLTPFMTQATKNPKEAIHWGVRMTTPIADNQPFGILYYHDGQDHSPAPEVDLNAHSDLYNLKSAPFQIDLTKRAYVAIKFGDATQTFFVLFVQGFRPHFFQIKSNVATLLSTFDAVNGEALFTPDNRWFQFKIEPVRTGFIITLAGQQFITPWIVEGPDEEPYILRSGQVEIYSGNVTAGFAMRPMQYIAQDSFTTPPNIISRLPSDTREVSVTTTVKGAADDQNKLAKDPITGLPVLFAVDAEIVNGDTFGNVRNPINDLAKDGVPAQSGKRVVDLEVLEKEVPATGAATNAGFSLNKNEYNVKVTLRSTDVTQPNGFVVTNGRSPYLWQVRLALPMLEPQDSSGGGIDISCNVKEVDLSWNSTSLNELNHSGTIKVFSRPIPDGGMDLEGYLDRAVYFRVEAYWENGVGHDPGGEGRQIFEGMSVHSSRDTKAEYDLITFKVEDYMNALEGGKFVLSPYYDGMKAKAAVRDIAQLAGLGESRILADDTPIPAQVPNDPEDFGLPFSNPFQEPQFRFKDGSSYKSALVKIAQLDGKTIYFDHLGRFHYDTIAGGTTGGGVAPDTFFWTSPLDAAEGKECCWGTASFGRNINDTYNVIQVSTVDRRTGNPIHIAYANEDAILPSGAGKEGYLGYRKHLMIREPALGDEAAAIRYISTYRNIVSKPPMTIRFEAYGYSGLKPMDTIAVDGFPVRILNISCHINAQENTYWMNVEAESFLDN